MAAEWHGDRHVLHRSYVRRAPQAKESTSPVMAHALSFALGCLHFSRSLFLFSEWRMKNGTG